MLRQNLLRLVFELNTPQSLIDKARLGKYAGILN